jgi:hypothetical protein
MRILLSAIPRTLTLSHIAAPLTENALPSCGTKWSVVNRFCRRECAALGRVTHERLRGCGGADHRGCKSASVSALRIESAPRTRAGGTQKHRTPIRA